MTATDVTVVAVEDPTDVTIIVADPVAPTQVDVDAETIVVAALTVGPQGATGPQGPPGNAIGTFIFDQGVPSATWVIDHPLGGYPVVTIVDSAGTVVVGDVTYVSTSRVIATFAAPFGGKAYLN